MQRKAYAAGVAALLAALLAGCTGSSGDGGTTDNSNPGEPGTATQAAEPGKYAALPEPCGAVDQKLLDELLPGIAQLPDEAQREKAYAGEATVTFDTDRKAGCRWKVESAQATNHLRVDFERVVSYDNAVSDDSEAERLFARLLTEADLAEPEAGASGSASTGGDDKEDGDGEGAKSPKSPPSSGSSSGTSPSSPSSSSSGLPSRVLEDLGDEAYLADELSSSGSTAKQRTVTVAFRTSNVIVTVEYAEQSAMVGVVPDSEEMQDRARKLASGLSGSLSG
ncbi:DUF3558 domain-containing protein [Streptomyces sp. SBST2-5]|uniref:DUF3558 domain-containing protein n=1 Tax=Streptomyces composti TaxID=2720025 RepID=A0ABX1A6C8_9ACTN|nr:DUF3558 domain-containing protein [Streptomyces composti]NJP49103.1 DUF3558 domain-containing protein [Streptomyces composti]